MRNAAALLLLTIFSSLVPSALAADTLPPAAPPYYRVEYAPSTTPGELVFGVSYTIWIPPGVKTLRGIVVHQHGCGEGACRAGQTAAFDLHWQALAAKHECALLGPSYQQPEKEPCELWCDPRNGSAKKFLQSLDDLAKQSAHPELATVPWALWGHSGGAKWVGIMLLLHPDRCAAVWMRSGSPASALTAGRQPAMTIPAAAYSVPSMCNLGTREGVTEKDGKFAGVWNGVRPFFVDFRAKGGLIGVAVDPKSSHDCGNQRYLAIPWFDSILTSRLPEKAADATLRPIPTAGVFLAPLLGDAAVAANEYEGDVNAAVWLPNAPVAKAWAEYAKDGNVTDTSPPPAPTEVKLRGAELTWSAVADLESGIAGFIIERDGVELARLPAKPAGTIGRPVFQKTNYSDTPTPPVAEMRFIDPSPAGKHVYRVVSVNSVGLKSEPSREVTSP